MTIQPEMARNCISEKFGQIEEWTKGNITVQNKLVGTLNSTENLNVKFLLNGGCQNRI